MNENRDEDRDDDLEALRHDEGEDEAEDEDSDADLWDECFYPSTSTSSSARVAPAFLPTTAASMSPFPSPIKGDHGDAGDFKNYRLEGSEDPSCADDIEAVQEEEIVATASLHLEV
jgi:hypothetical protein